MMLEKAIEDQEPMNPRKQFMLFNPNRWSRRRTRFVLVFTAAATLMAASGRAQEDEQLVHRQMLYKSKRFADVAHEINEPISKAYLQAVGTALLTIVNVREIEKRPEDAEQLDAFIVVFMMASKTMEALDTKAAPAEFRDALSSLEKLYLAGLQHMIDIKKGKRKGLTRRLTRTSWLGDLTEAKSALDDVWSNLRGTEDFPLSKDDSRRIKELFDATSSAKTEPSPSASAK